jgi:hypothetical protein
MSLYLFCFQGTVLLGLAIYCFCSPCLAMLKHYFAAQGVYTAALFILRINGVPLESNLFAIVYALATVMMLFYGLAITMLWALDHRATGTLFFVGAVVTALFCWLNLRGQPPSEICGWIYILEGSWLIGQGTVLGFTAFFLLPWEILPALILSFLWVFLGLFRQGYRLHWGQPAWDWANDWLPWGATSAALLLMGLILRSQFRGAVLSRLPGRSA